MKIQMIKGVAQDFLGKALEMGMDHLKKEEVQIKIIKAGFKLAKRGAARMIKIY